MGKICVVTSLKGGVGKTLFSSGLAYQLAKVGKKVLAVDMDLGTGGLDIALGREDTLSSTLLDILSGRVTLKDALYAGADGVCFLAAPVFFNESSLEDVTQDNFNALLTALKQYFDFVIFDMPAGGGAAFRFFEKSELVDQMILVTTPAPTAVRAAERCAMRLSKPDNIRLILNSFRLSSPEDNAVRIVEAIRRTSVPILGVIPFDNGAEKALAKGQPMTAVKKSVAAKAIANVAERLTGETVPLMRGLMKPGKRQKYY